MTASARTTAALLRDMGHDVVEAADGAEVLALLAARRRDGELATCSSAIMRCRTSPAPK